ncbi:hypothetical protein WA026_018494 [Henosepilachna vigintioctopunctata]
MMSLLTKNISNFAFLHISSTGLPEREGNNTRITELCITVIESKNIVNGVHTRVKNKINLCFKPGKDITAEAVKQSGLSNSDLENQASFSSEVGNCLNGFLNLIDGPICFVAHYGNEFDYPILRAALSRAGQSLNENILCVDSTRFFQYHERVEQRIRQTWALRDIYQELTSIHPTSSHTAEGFVDCLIYCVSRYAHDFVIWANKDARTFSSIHH